jgi:predicted TPR repeat methyltransferase
VNPNAEILTDIFVFVGVITAMGCFTGLVTTWIKYRAKRISGTNVDARLMEIAERIAKLDNAVDSMAIEVERISEGQRFVTKLLADRGTTPALPDAARAGGSTPRH